MRCVPSTPPAQADPTASASYNQADPSINHLIIAPADGEATIGLTTDSDRHEVLHHPSPLTPPPTTPPPSPRA